MKTTALFTIGTTRVEVTLDRAALPQPAHPNGYVSFTGTMDGGGGQIVNTLRSSTDHADVQAVCDAWNTWHLKDDDPSLDATVDALRRLHGQHIDRPDTTDDEDPEECSFSSVDDTIDSREVINRIEYLEAFVADHPDHVDAQAELKTLQDLESEASGYAADWRYGETLIAESYFETYAQQMAEDIGAINKDASWPNDHIDWEAAAEALKADYTEVEFDGHSFWIR